MQAGLSDTLNSAKSYTDQAESSGMASTLTRSNNYTDQATSAILNESRSYTDAAAGGPSKRRQLGIRSVRRPDGTGKPPKCNPVGM